MAGWRIHGRCKWGVRGTSYRSCCSAMAEDGDLDLIHRSKGEECVNSKYIES